MVSFHTTDFRALAPQDPAVLVKAIDAQPDIAADFCADLDPDPWMGDGSRRWASGRDDDVHDNTLHAGLALTAVLRFMDLAAGADAPLDEAAEVAVQAYRSAADLDDAEHATILRELIAGSLHLMDARDLDLTTQPGQGLQLWLSTMLFELERRCQGPWAARLDADCTDFGTLLAAACDDYVNQVTYVALATSTTAAR